MRLLGLSPPLADDVAFDSIQPMTMSLGRLTGWMLGDLDSTTSTSPFGSTYTERGCSRSLASASTFRPAATVGFSSAFQPTTDARCIGGNRYWCGSGRLG